MKSKRIKYVSFDPAIKSLAVTIMTYKNVAEHVDSLLKSPQPRTIRGVARYVHTLRQILHDRIDIQIATHVDLCPGIVIKKADRIAITRNLHAFLDSIDHMTRDAIVLIEIQPRLNRMSNIIVGQLMMYYWDREIRMVDPGDKSRHYIRGYPGTLYRHFAARYSDRYVANKNHSKYMFLKYAELLGFDVSHIETKRMADVADSFTNALIYACSCDRC